MESLGTERPSYPPDPLICVQSGQAVLLVCSLQDASAAGEKIQLQEGLLYTQQQLLFYQLRQKKASSYIMRQRLPGAKGNERNTDISNARVAAAVLGSLKKERPTKSFS